jgi:cobalt-zinc-cadmium efflux system protein
MSGKVRILIAFLLNLCFSIAEFIGGMLIGSVAILSDAIHDCGDAISIGISYFMEKISDRPANDKYTYGYKRYSVLGGLVTTIILLCGSAFMIYSAINRLFNPTEINYSCMIILAAIGLIINFVAGLITHKGHSINQKAVTLHLMEDMFGWAIVLMGAIIMKFTNWYWLDPLLSIGLAIFVIVHAVKILTKISNMFLMKTPQNIHLDVVKASIILIPGVNDVHHLHVWTLDGETVFASMHIVAKYSAELKHIIKNTLEKRGIHHVTIEFEGKGEECKEIQCNIKHNSCGCCHYH